MEFLSKKELFNTKKFLNDGYIISKVENKYSLDCISKLINHHTKKILRKKKVNFNHVHKYISVDELNDFRVNLINKLNKDKNTKYHYFNLAKSALYTLVGNELMMQKNINLSIQFPNDNSSLLPIHSDVWSGDSAYEINLWIPLVNCYKTKSMYILEKKYNKKFINQMKKKKISNSNEIFKLVKNNIKWLNVKYGQYLVFDQTLPHGNIINFEKETRWSMNCRFKSIFSPYGDKKIGEFFIPITERAMTKIGLNFEYPFYND